nr:MAG TPA: hypothetical protein [Caudoviricetes sp.]
MLLSTVCYCFNNISSSVANADASTSFTFSSQLF